MKWASGDCYAIAVLSWGQPLSGGESDPGFSLLLIATISLKLAPDLERGYVKFHYFSLILSSG